MTYKRKKMQSAVVINSGIDDVFPLLCPERERDWLPGWNYEMVFSNSGLIEVDCIFKNFADGEKIDWICTTHDKSNYKIYFIQYFNTAILGELGLSLSIIDDETTKMEILQTRTALNEKGNELVESYSNQDFVEFWNKIGKMIEYYLEHDKMIEL